MMNNGIKFEKNTCYKLKQHITVCYQTCAFKISNLFKIQGLNQTFLFS